MFWENSGGGLTTQPVGTATMTTVTSANRVDLESFSSRCWTFRRTHTSADPNRVLCTRLALPLTLSLSSRLAPRARLTAVDVPTRALWLAGIFLRRKKRCAGVVGTRTDWVLKGEDGGMTTPLLQYVARFDGGGDIFGFGEVTRRVGYGAPSLSDSRLYLLRQAARNQLYPCVGRGQACPPFPTFSSP